MSEKRDYYEVLSVERTASSEELRKAYKREALKHHPDRNPGDAAAEAKFKECNEAYQVLSNDEKRQIYDQFGHDGLRGRGAAAHDFSRMNPDDIFSMFNDIFGGGGGARTRGGRRVARGYDLETEVTIELSDVLKGTERDVEFTRLDVCNSCTGTGAKPGSKPETCATCSGQGKVQQAGLGGMFRMVTACPTCRGRGTIIKDKCETCKGKGRTSKSRSLMVRIPAGIQDGQVVRIQGEGEPPASEISPSGEGVRGDLHVVVRVSEHSFFQREGDHLVFEMPIGFSQATLGAEIEVPTLEGKHTLKIPAGTQHGELFRIREQGTPNLRSGKRGDLVVLIKIEIPKKLTKAQQKLLREFAATEDKSVLPESHGFLDKIRDMLGG